MPIGTYNNIYNLQYLFIIRHYTSVSRFTVRHFCFTAENLYVIGTCNVHV